MFLFVFLFYYDYSLLVSASSAVCHVLALVFPSHVFLFMFGSQPGHIPSLRLHYSVISRVSGSFIITGFTALFLRSFPLLPYLLSHYLLFAM